MAYGLGGNLVLRDASCKECATKTSRFEETVLRQMFGPYRVRIDMPSRHRKRRPKELLFEVVKKDGNVAIISVDPKEHPGSIVFPVFPEPGVLVCREDNAGFQMGLCASTDFPRVKTLAETHGGRGFSLGVADFNSMARLLAKTAHAYCFAEFGDFRAAYQPLVLDLIAGDPNCCPTRCVGCVPGNAIAEPEPGIAHRMAVSEAKAPDGTGYLVTDIRLFALLRSPVYRVAVAKRR